MPSDSPPPVPLWRPAVVSQACTLRSPRARRPCRPPPQAEGEIGGVVSWSEPSDPAAHRVTAYAIFLATDATGVTRSQIGSDISVGTSSAAVPEGTETGHFSHLLVYTKNAGGVQTTTPEAILAVRPQSSAEHVSFADDDGHEGSIGGEVAWREPADISTVGHYAVYLATNADGSDKIQQGDDQAATTGGATMELSIPSETALGGLGGCLG